MASLSLIQFGFDQDGRLQLCVAQELWAAMREIAVSEEVLAATDGFVRINLQEIAGLDVRSISIGPRDEQPPCPPRQG